MYITCSNDCLKSFVKCAILITESINKDLTEYCCDLCNLNPRI